METLYLDTLICVNLFIDYILLCIIRLILHINAKLKNLLFASVFGSLTTLWVLIPIQSVFISALYKIATTIFIVLIAYGKCDFRKFTIRCLMFMAISMILSVIVTAINLLYKPTGVFIYNDQIYIDVSPVSLIISTIIAYIIISMYQKLSSKNKLNCRIYSVTISQGSDTNITFESALDTGCNLSEPFSSLPVILTEKDLLKGIDITKDKLRIIPCSTVTGTDIIYAFKPDKIQIDGKALHKGCYIGICSNKINGEVKSIMGPQITEAL